MTFGPPRPPLARQRPPEGAPTGLACGYCWGGGTMPGKSPNLKIFKIGLYRLPSICPDNDPGNGWEEVILVWGQLPSVATQSHSLRCGLRRR